MRRVVYVPHGEQYIYIERDMVRFPRNPHFTGFRLKKKSGGMELNRVLRQKFQIACNSTSCPALLIGMGLGEMTIN